MSTIEEQLTSEEDESLSTEMRKIQSATDGETIYGIITEEPRTKTVGVPSEEYIVLEVETPIESFELIFDKPKPPLEDYPFYRLAEEYGQGLVDINALEGEKIPCRYNNEWEVVIPKTSKEKANEIFHDMFHAENVEKVLYVIGAIVAMPITYVSALTFMVEKVRNPREGHFDKTDATLLTAILTIVFGMWLMVVYAILFF